MASTASRPERRGKSWSAFRTTLTPNSTFSDADMPPAVAAATIQLWQSGTLSKRTAHQKLAKGRLRTLIGISTPSRARSTRPDPSGNNPDDHAGD